MSESRRSGAAKADRIPDPEPWIPIPTDHLWYAFQITMASKYDQFKLVTDFELRGDQPQAIDELVAGLNRGDQAQVLMGVTGSGKTFTMANVIQHVQRPTLVLSHNKTLAAQLYSEFKEFFPHNAVELLRQLLRLLPARGVHSAARHLHREGRLDQRGDRPPAAGGHQLAGRAAAT